MASDNDEDSWSQVLTGLLALVVVSLLVGGVVSVVALGAAKVSGVGSSSGRPTQQLSLYIPSGEPSTRPEVYPDPTGGASPSPSESSSPTDTPTKPDKNARTITLQAFPGKVAPGQRINLTGVYSGGEGATLQVQRYDGSWTDFPVTASVSGGLYNTWIVTSRSGKQKFRVLDIGSNRHSNPVTVTIG